MRCDAPRLAKTADGDGERLRTAVAGEDVLVRGNGAAGHESEPAGVPGDVRCGDTQTAQ
jgi:hypothetical protein